MEGKQYKIGPHNIDILSILIGSLLGDAYGERRKQGAGTRISFYQENTHEEYLIWLHKRVSELGYCNSKIPEIKTRLGKNGKIRKVLRFHTWTYVSFNWIQKMYYVDNRKIVPKDIAIYITPLALAIWIMDDGGKVGSGLKLATNSFSYEDCVFLTNVLYNNFKLKSTVQSAGAPNQYHIYIWKESMVDLWNIVSKHVVPSMKYKFII